MLPCLNAIKGFTFYYWEGCTSFLTKLQKEIAFFFLNSKGSWLELFRKSSGLTKSQLLFEEKLATIIFYCGCGILSVAWR